MMPKTLGCRLHGKREARLGLTGMCRIALAHLAVLALFGGAWGCRGKADGHPPEATAVSQGESAHPYGQPVGKVHAAVAGEEGYSHGTGEEGHGHGTGEEGHGHGTGEAAHGHGTGDEGHGHGTGLDLEEAAQQPCEHEVPISECDECRYEAGLVKVPADVAARLLATVEVKERMEPDHSLRLRCEAGTDRQATAEVTALLGGRVEQVVRTLGQRVEAGDVLAILQSQDAARARMEHIRAHQELELAEIDQERVRQVHESLKTILAGLGDAATEQVAADGSLDKSIFGGLPAGEQKARLLVALNEFQEAARLAKIERERLAEGNRLLGRKVAGPAGNGTPAAEGADESGGSLSGADARVPGQDRPGPYAGEWRRLLSEARETRDLARKDLERIEGLVRSGVRSSRELDAARRDLAVAEAATRAARETVGLEIDRRAVEIETLLRSARIRMEGRSEEIALHMEAELARARQAVDAASANEALAHRSLLLIGIGEEALERQIPLNSPELWRLEVRAPVQGTVVKQNASVGRTVVQGDPLLTLSDTASAWVWCDLYPQDLAALATVPLPLPARVEGDGLPGSGISGSLDYIERSADPHTRTVKARIVVTGTEIRPGTFLSARILFGPGKAGLLVPEAAVLSDGTERFVFVHWKDELWARRDVDALPAGEGLVRIVSGLKPGDQVAVRGAFFLKSDVLREKMGAGCAD